MSEMKEENMLIGEPEKPVQFDGPQLMLEDVEVDGLIRVVQARDKFSVSGAGLTVAVLDTGLNAGHVDFSGKVVAQRNYTGDNGGDENNADDGQGHGTNVGGIIVANAQHTGIAPGANIIPIKVLPNQGGGTFQAVLDGLRWVLENHSAHNISVVNMSLGDSGNYLDDTFFNNNETRAVIAELRAANVIVVAAAGNEYFQYKLPGMGFPAILQDTVSVGAVYDANEGGFSYRSGAKANTTGKDRFTPFTQRLHETDRATTRTDIFAPGAPVTSSGINSSTGESVQHGTSQASPVTAGVIMLMQEFYRTRTGTLPTLELLVECLRNGSVPIVDGDDEDDNVPHTLKTYMRLDALLALDTVRRKLQMELFTSEMPFQPETVAARG